MEEKLLNLKNQAISNILEAKSSKDLEALRISFFGRKGIITEIVKQMPALAPEKRKEVGRLLNEVKKTIEETINNQQSTINNQQSTIESDWLDVTAPGLRPSQGHLHLITQTIEEITKIFEKIGFTRVSYPEVEWDWYAFEGLNMPKNHPARDEWETFFIEGLSHPKFGEAILTPHTSSGQLREMKRMGKPPIRMLNIAKCYRRQSDISHAPMFYQFEGLVIDRGINITHLKGTLDYFVKQYFGSERQARIRPFHFQFTEPSFEVDVTCFLCKGKGCKVCKDGWLELGGSGMVHPIVLKNGGIDPKEYTGFAWGWGVERVMMMKYGIPDIRLLFGGDLRFLNQF
ncbi:MAG: phenylalanine--tRNA ligase subunit alpha [bacterium]|nr:phenylalanine--tRNA ligase subunit alpha [bacterium]